MRPIGDFALAFAATLSWLWAELHVLPLARARLRTGPPRDLDARLSRRAALFTWFLASALLWGAVAVVL
jgi:hypothetical protein